MRPTFPAVAGLCLAAALLDGCKRKAPDAAPVSSPGVAAPAVAERSTVLAELPDAPPDPDATFVFAAGGGGVAWVSSAAGRARVVHDGREGPAYDGVRAPLLSADGRRCAYAARRGAAWRLVQNGREGPAFDDIGKVVLGPDGAHVAYEARVGASWLLVVDDRPRPAGPGRHPWIEFAADGRTLGFLDQADADGRGRLVVADLVQGGERLVDPQVVGPILGPDGLSVAAVAERDGRQQVLSFRLDAAERVTRGPAYDRVVAMAFSADAAAVGYYAVRGDAYYATVGDREERLPDGESIVDLPAISSRRHVAVAVIAGGGVRVREFIAPGSRSGGAYAGVEGLTYSPDGSALAFVAERDGKFLVVANGKEGPAFDRVVSPAFSPDGTRLVYRAREEGRRFVVVADGTGKVLRRDPTYEQVFPVRFTADGRSIAYGVKDGRQLAWRVEPL